MSSIASIEINENFELAFKFVTETNENVFLTGKAGTGKTTFLKYLKENSNKNIIVAAPTGVAAINAGGVTLHSLFQLPFHPFIPTHSGKTDLLGRLRLNSRRQDLLRKMDLLVIDEISMVRCDTLDAIDTILRSVRRKHNVPFGGVQMLFIGDLYQLPPVAPRQDWMVLQEFYATEFFFDSNVIRQDIPVLVELKKIFRQKEDSFIRLLNKVRNNDMDPDDFEDLHMRFFPGFQPDSDEKFITLTSHNNQADQINNRELQKLSSMPFVYEAVIEGDFPESMYPAEGSLVLKEGAQVMFLKNDAEKRYFNGKIGVVKSLSDDEIVIDCDGINIYVQQEIWENSRYTLNRNDGKLEQEILGTFSQFPLRLAWAITIHKSQGLTFEKVMIDAGAAFSSGQVYVALSRCTNLEGIVLLSKIPPSAIHSNESVVKCHQALSPRGSLAERFEGARQVYTSQLLEELFSFNEIQVSLDALYSKIYEYREKLNEAALPWINTLKSEFKNLRSVGLKFIDHIALYMKKEPIIENNSELQKRISDAAYHFSPGFIKLKDSVFHHPVVTEHRESSSAIDQYLNELLLQIFYQNYLFEYCKNPFSVTGLLQQRLKYAAPRIKVSCYASGKKQHFSDIDNIELFEKLKIWRDKVCEESGLPIYMVANQNALREISTYLPLTKKDLMKINGFGKVKSEKYGDDILEAVKEYCSKSGLESKIDLLEVSSRKMKKTQPPEVKIPTHIISFNLFKEGKTIEEIAKERNMATSTIEGHLSVFITDGVINIDQMIPPETQKLVKDAVKIHGRESFRVLKENLPDDISYGQIRMTLAALKEQ